MSSRIRFKRGTSQQWENADAPLGPGEPGWDTQSGILKIGDGSTWWRDLPTVAPLSDSAVVEALEKYIDEHPGDLVTPEYVADAIAFHVADTTPHPVYDDGPSLVLIFENGLI